MDGSVEAFLTAARMHATHGTTLLYPTTLTSTNTLLYATFETYRRAVVQNTDGARFGGLHLEGPYFSPLQSGAQDKSYLRNPEPKEYLEILNCTDDIARWSFAPELPGSGEFIKELNRRGILAAAAHTNATFEEMQEALTNGLTHLTHFYSCMSSITRRNAYRHAGVLEFGYYYDDVTIEIIADGIHVPSSLLNLVRKIKGADRIALVTDSMRAAGMPEGPSILGALDGGQAVIVEEGVAKLPDRSAFAGSVATTDRLVRTAITLGGFSLEDAVRMMTLTPARIMHIDDRKGAIRCGADADLVIFDKDITIQRTIINGKTIFTKC
jgi:N-acetylglucosamine-6-phosphate deacetylase